MPHPYLKSIHVRNYLGMDSADFEGFRRINLIGGLNGAGKTTMLEAVFMYMDQLGPYPFLRPSMFRQVPQQISLTASMFRNQKRPIDIEAETRFGKSKLSLIWERQALEGTVPVAPNFSGEMVSGGQTMGMTVSVDRGNERILQRSMVPVNDGLMMNEVINKVDPFPSCVFLSRSTMNSSIETATRFSELLQQGRKQEILSLARAVQPGLSDIHLLQFGNTTVLHAQLENGQLVPLSYTGEGVQTIITIGLAILSSPNGVVIIDEFEAAIHYSRLRDIWVYLGDIAMMNECQIFVATHSRENIDAAMRSVEKRDRRSDICYYRIDRVKERTLVTRFDYDNLRTANLQDWEVR